MLEKISSISCRFPWLVFIVVAAVSVFMAQQIRENAHFEADLVKFLPTDMPAVKSDDYSRKNFNTQNTMLIGIEKHNGLVLEPDVLRVMERIVVELKDLRASKTFYSFLKEESVTLVQPVGIDPDAISSIANLEDAILDEETGSVVSGSIIKNLKKEFGIASEPGLEEMLPDSDKDLLKILPGIRDRIMMDRTFRGNIMSEDMKAATIRVSTIRQQVYKRRYAILELLTAIDERKLKDRFQGNESAFPFEIYGKTINGILVNDDYIQEHAERVRTALKKYLIRTLEGTFSTETDLKRLLDRRLTAQLFGEIMQHLERNDFFMHLNMGTWRSFTDGIYEFTLENIDPFSLESLEFQIHDVKNIVDMAEIYHLTNRLVQKYQIEGVTFHIAGNPVVIGVISEMMSGDMTRLVPIAIGVILLILVLSFKSVRGVIIPLVTVVLAVIWTLGLMAYLGVPFTISTSGLPIIILAVGTAYSIHFLNRYYEDSQHSTDKFIIVQRSMQHVGGAIFMAAVTTVAGFSSLTTTSLTTIQEFGQFSAIGVIIALVLTLTLTPALLVMWKIPKKNPLFRNQKVGKEGFISASMKQWSKVVIKHPLLILVLFLTAILISLILMRTNHFEGSIMSTFKEDNIIFQSDRFLNKNLTGTTDINLIFSFRNRINLEKQEIREALQRQIEQFLGSLNNLSMGAGDLQDSFLPELVNSLQKNGQNLPESESELIAGIELRKDILNEEYSVEIKKMNTGQTETSGSVAEGDADSLSEEDGGIDALADDMEADSDSSEGDLDELADPDNSGETEDDLGDLDQLSDDSDDSPGEIGEGPRFTDMSAEQIEGLKDLNRRLGSSEDSWQQTAQSILLLRAQKTSQQGMEMQKRFNLLNDFLSVDIKQPVVLHKLENLHQAMSDLEEPKVVIEGQVFKPSGMIVTPVDYVRKFYKVFYHDDNPAFDRLPNTETDGFTDKTLTDRSIIGVVLNQALNSDRDGFEAMITPNLKEFQVKIMIRDGSTITIDRYVEQVMKLVKERFPGDDPYIESIRTGGAAFTGMQISKLIGSSQMKSIALSFLFVFIVTFFIFRSLPGGLFSLIPLLFTVILNFGFLAILGGEITMTTMLVASVAIGIGVDYTIHFLERLKIQLRYGDDLAQAYTATVMSSGRAILVNATAVAMGFLVFLFSTFNSQIMLGILVAATMAFSSLGALTLLPAVILRVKPDFLRKVMKEADPNGKLASTH